jgi:hypothetical protein
MAEETLPPQIRSYSTPYTWIMNGLLAIDKEKHPPTPS